MKNDLKEKYDQEFINLIIEIEKRYHDITKTERLRLDNWV
jgi:hypothetical protein